MPADTSHEPVWALLSCGAPLSAREVTMASTSYVAGLFTTGRGLGSLHQTIKRDMSECWARSERQSLAAGLPWLRCAGPRPCCPQRRLRGATRSVLPRPTDRRGLRQLRRGARASAPRAGALGIVLRSGPPRRCLPSPQTWRSSSGAWWVSGEVSSTSPGPRPRFPRSSG